LLLLLQRVNTHWHFTSGGTMLGSDARGIPLRRWQQGTGGLCGGAQYY